MAKTDLSPQELRAKAELYCARAEHCEQDVRTKLRAWGSSTALADTIIDHLLDNNYLNPARYCRAFVHDKLLYQGWGRIKMRSMLHAHGLPTSDIDQALAAIDEDEYLAVLRRVARKKESATREQQIRFLLQRGFEYSLIEQTIP